ncbi:MAG: PQQ-dependent sugar dehydrogenase [Pseudomonadales bacterium]|jgi:glucose/arabinose dehydrogenase|nr:PQQ-dependent sugar dehydrogenase [Pseudomonadales bacterium]
MFRRRILVLATSLLLPLALVGPAGAAEFPFEMEAVASFDEPWAVAFLPDGRMLVTEKKGNLLIVTQDGDVSRPIPGVPDVAYGGQGGLGDVALHPEFEDNGLVYLSYAEPGTGGTRGAAVARGRLVLDARGRGRLEDVEVIWRQYPKVLGNGHYGHRLLFDGDGYLWISSGDRQKFTPAQDMQANLGKVLRLHDDGSVPEDNPFVDLYDENPLLDDVGVYPQVWSLGHRNPLGLALDLEGRLWELEMGPAGGDELNLVRRGANYGYPLVSNGDHYDGREIPDHDTRPEFEAPAAFWVPAISPGDLMIYGGDRFSDWKGNAFAAGLSSQAVIRIELDGETAREVERFEFGQRIRSVVEGPDGAIWVLEDDRGSSDGELLRLTPR